MAYKEYYLGLDMGTSTVGWALTDTEYNLIRKKGKDLWGIREFEEAKTAIDRRSYRTNRRRHQREQVRSNLVRSYFADAINEIDPVFFQRLDNSKYYLEDKDADVRTPNGIFNDKDYTDKEYYRDFPTIFHLRKDLIENQRSPYDVRLVYLAVSNMFKHRGHFLNAGLSDEGETVRIEDALDQFFEVTEEVLGVSITGTDLNSLKTILTSKKLTKTQKTEQIASALEIDKKQKSMMECCKAICGRSVDVLRIFESIDDIEEKVSFSFSSFDDETEDKLIKSIGDDRYRLISSMKTVYDACLLSEILGGYDYLSMSRVSAYEKHKEDLKVLKRLIKNYGTEEQYEKMFRSTDSGTYGAYVNSVNSGKKHRRDMKGRKQGEFYDYVKRMIKAYPDVADKQYIINEIDKELFMPKQLTAANGVIPNQVHARELRAILNNASEYLSFLNETDESGLTVAERIIRLFSFQIPYYVGPVTPFSEKRGGNGWVVRKEEGAVLPWNIESKIDMDATRQRFISRLIRDCTYLNGEKVLPKASLMYEKYCVLNEINNLKVDGEKIPVEIKQGIFDTLFKQGRKVKPKEIAEYLKSRGCLREIEQLSGIDITINNSLSSYGKFKSILGDVIDTDRGQAMVEEIIYLTTIYGDSKRFLKEQLRSRFKDLTDKQIERITGLKFRDWGRLSKEFLELEGAEKGTGEIRTIIRAMWETNYNLMELLSDDKFTYCESLEVRKKKVIDSLADITPDTLDEFYFSAPVKKMINQTVKIIREAEQIMGCAPSRLFIEMTRGDGVKGDRGRVDSRKKQLTDLYKNIKDESHDWISLIEQEDNSGRLRSKKMYLYITQMGRDMYTGLPIDLENLFDDNLYDIDHIYPRHFVKDDSIHNNLVLVNKGSNAHKSDTFPLESSIRNDAFIAAHWKNLKDKGLITEEKYRRLISSKPFTDEQKADFIARQLVETGQGTKAVADFLRQALPETTVVYCKAANVSEFRNKYGFVKSRLVNDFHHANDAYLNIVVGNVYYTKFTLDPRNYIRKDYKSNQENSDYNLSKMFDRNVQRKGSVAWIADTNDGPGTISTVKRVMSRNTPIMTRQSFCGHGGIADQTLYSKVKAQGVGYLPLKSTKDEKLNDVTKYGGFKNASTAYFCLVEHTVRKKRVRTLEAVPILLVDEIKKDQSALTDYLVGQLKLVDPSVRLPKIPLQSLIRFNGYIVHISGKTGDRIAIRNAVNLCISSEWISYIKELEKYKRYGGISSGITKEQNAGLYKELIEKHSSGIFSRRPNPIGSKIQDKFNQFIQLSIEDQCYVLLQILRISAIGADSQADLRKIDYSEHTGVMLMSKAISGYDQCELINASIMGVRSEIIDLLTI